MCAITEKSASIKNYEFQICVHFHTVVVSAIKKKDWWPHPKWAHKKKHINSFYSLSNIIFCSLFYFLFCANLWIFPQNNGIRLHSSGDGVIQDVLMMRWLWKRKAYTVIVLERQCSADWMKTSNLRPYPLRYYPVKIMVDVIIFWRQSCNCLRKILS